MPLNKQSAKNLIKEGARIMKSALSAPKKVYRKLEEREARKKAESPYEWKRVGGSQPIRVKKKGY